MKAERGRPRWHPTAPTGWMSDPNGPVFWNGRWHVFYQHNPAAPEWGLMRWGHLTTSDFATWTDHGIALTPRPGAGDADGCWSGCIRILDGEPVAFYTGARGTGHEHAQVVLRARGSHDLAGFAADPEDPVADPDPAAAGTSHQRDPFLLRVGDEWLMLLGTAVPGRGGAVVAWRSSDTVTWQYAGEVFSPARSDDPVDTGPVWECPQLLHVGDDWVLIVSVQLPGEPNPLCPYALWFVGDFDGARFTERARGMLDGGRVLFAPAAAHDPAGRILLWAWIQESAEERSSPSRPWAGTMSATRELTVVDGRVVTTPARELDRRWRPLHVRHERIAAGRDLALPTPDVPDFRLRVAGAGDWSAELGLDGRGDRLRIAVATRAAERILRIELVGADGARVLAESPAGGAPAVEILVDASIVEAFCGSAAVTARVDPELRPALILTATGPDALALDVAVDRAADAP